MTSYQKLGKNDAIESQGCVLAGNEAQYLAWIEDNGLSSAKFPRLSSSARAREVKEGFAVYLVGSWFDTNLSSKIEAALPPCRLLMTFASWEYESIE